jgi:hypothetical protein
MKALQTGIDARAAIRQAPILEALQKQKLANAQAQAEARSFDLSQAQRGAGIQAESEKGRFINTLAKQVRSAPLDQRANIINQNSSSLQAFGVDPGRLTDLSDQSLDNTITATNIHSAPVAPQKTAVLSEGEKLFDVGTGQEIASGGEKQSPDKTASLVQNLRSRHDKFNQDLKKVDAAFKKIETAPETASGDISMLFSFMKLNDPGSTVREGEFATAQNAAGVPTRIQNLYNNAIEGTRLSADQRSEFKDTARGLFSAQQASADESTALILQQADQDGVSRARVIGSKALRDFEKRAADRLIGAGDTPPKPKKGEVFKSSSGIEFKVK